MAHGQLDLFGGEILVPQGTTAIYPNRIADKAQVECLLGLPEHPGDQPLGFFTSKGTCVAQAYVRVVYGDHGPYIEFAKSQILCELKPKFGHRVLPPDAYYEWLVPADGSDVKIYDQKRDVRHIRNAPAGGVAGNRAEGYADYVPGMIYVSPWDIEVRLLATTAKKL